jgi:hypothetical protein
MAYQPKAMDSNIRPSKVYNATININNAKSEKNYKTKEEVENNQQWGKILLSQNFST